MLLKRAVGRARVGGRALKWFLPFMGVTDGHTVASAFCRRFVPLPEPTAGLLYASRHRPQHSWAHSRIESLRILLNLSHLPRHRRGT